MDQLGVILFWRFQLRQWVIFGLLLRFSYFLLPRRDSPVIYSGTSRSRRQRDTHEYLLDTCSGVEGVVVFLRSRLNISAFVKCLLLRRIYTHDVLINMFRTEIGFWSTWGCVLRKCRPAVDTLGPSSSSVSNKLGPFCSHSIHTHIYKYDNRY